MYSELDLKAKFYQAQRDELERVEGRHRAEPPVQHMIGAVALSATEAGVAFWLLLPGGVPLALLVAGFTVALIWGAAVYEADQFELPEQYEKLIEEYDDSIQS